MEIKSTRLRYIAAKSRDQIVAALDSLPYMVEIKGGPVLEGKFWVVWFVIPDNVPQFKSVILK